MAARPLRRARARPDGAGDRQRRLVHGGAAGVRRSECGWRSARIRGAVMRLFVRGALGPVTVGAVGGAVALVPVTRIMRELRVRHLDRRSAVARVSRRSFSSPLRVRRPTFRPDVRRESIPSWPFVHLDWRTTAMIGPDLRHALRTLLKRARLHAGRCAHPGPRHRRQHGHLQRRQRRAPSTVAVCRARSDRPALGDFVEGRRASMSPIRISTTGSKRATSFDALVAYGG